MTYNYDYNYDYFGASRWDWMESLAAVLVRRAEEGHRTWFKRERSSAPMHPAIKQAVLLAPPADWHLLVLEHPHVADTDPSRIAYTRSDEHGNADRQTVTSVGKYLTRHFPTLADHRIRDIVMRHGSHQCQLWDTVEKIVKSVQDGPQSCMRWTSCDWDAGDTHPYETYHPDFGWRAAVRLDGYGTIIARCLVNVEANPPLFVRSYTRKDGQYSHSDEAIEVWLRDQGFEKADSWEGLRLKRITKDRYDDDFWAPYLDGNVKTVDDCGAYLRIDSDGEYTCERTDGHADGAAGCTCSDCGDRHNEEDMHSIGYHGDEHVGPCCIDSYTMAHGRNGCEYWIPEGDAIWVNGEAYDPDYLSRYDIVELDNGDYVHQDDAVYLEAREIWVHADSEDIVYCEHSGNYEHVSDCVQLHDGEWALESDAWQCEHDDEWYLCDDVSPFVTECGKSVHPDHADEYATETDNEEN